MAYRSEPAARVTAVLDVITRLALSAATVKESPGEVIPNQTRPEPPKQSGSMSTVKDVAALTDGV